MFEAHYVLETERLLLRELKEEDAEDLYEIFSSEEVMRYYGMYPVEEIESVKEMIRNFHSGFMNNRSIRWGIVEKLSSKVVGTCGFHCINERHLRTEIGYELSEKYWHKGYMQEALKEIIGYGFDKLKFMRIEGLIYPDNKSSRKSLEKLGFREEGLLREYMNFRDERTDLLIFSLLKREFKY